jgi:protein-S-isoprenylcysteine O-methyltransferase Ste14
MGRLMENKKTVLMATILTMAAVGQIVLAVIFYDEDGNSFVINLGWVVLWISAIFGWLPILTFRRFGKVPQGKGYMNTTVLVDRGVYAIVRHPQYLAGILMGLALPLISQHWSVTLLGIVVVIIEYMDTVNEEASCIVKFGEAYRQYMERVPRVNFLLGIIRIIGRKGSSSGKTQN